MKLFRYVILSIVLCFTCSSLIAQTKPMWLLNEWQRFTPKGEVLETWVEQSDSIWLGKSVRIQNSDTILLERVRLIFRNNELVYAPTVQGQNGNKEVEFDLIKQTQTSLTFENINHDFPQQIVYSLITKDSILASISGKIGDKEQLIYFPYKKKQSSVKNEITNYKGVILALTACLASALTFFSGFGLATMLTPVMMLFFPVHLAIGITAIVHFLNSLFKLFLVGNHANKTVLLKFGIPAILAALLGSLVLKWIPDSSNFITYSLVGNQIEVSLLKSIIAALLILFTLIDYIPKLKKIEFERSKLPIGGFLSGFFGGLSGNQGAFRTAFLIKTGLSKESFIATGVVIACFIDFTRISVYAQSLPINEILSQLDLIIITAIAAVSGAIMGNVLLKKITISMVQHVVAFCLILLSFCMLLGIL